MPDGTASPITGLTLEKASRRVPVDQDMNRTRNLWYAHVCQIAPHRSIPLTLDPVEIPQDPQNKVCSSTTGLRARNAYHSLQQAH